MIRRAIMAIVISAANTIPRSKFRAACTYVREARDVPREADGKRGKKTELARVVPTLCLLCHGRFRGPCPTAINLPLFIRRASSLLCSRENISPRDSRHSPLDRALFIYLYGLSNISFAQSTNSRLRAEINLAGLG